VIVKWTFGAPFRVTLPRLHADGVVVHLWFYGERINYAGQLCHSRVGTLDIRLVRSDDRKHARHDVCSIMKERTVVSVDVSGPPGVAAVSWYPGATRAIDAFMIRMRSFYSSHPSSIASRALDGFVAWYTPGIYMPCGIGRAPFRLFVDYVWREATRYKQKQQTDIVMWWFRLAKMRMRTVGFLPTKGTAYMLELFVMWVTRVSRVQAYIDDAYDTDQCVLSFNSPSGLALASGDCEDRTMNALYCGAMVLGAHLPADSEAARIQSWVSRHYELVLGQGVVKSTIRSFEFHVFSMLVPKQMLADMIRHPSNRRRRRPYLPCAMIEPNQSYQAVWSDTTFTRAEALRYENRPVRTDKNVSYMTPAHVLIRDRYYVSINALTLTTRQQRVYGTHKLIMSTGKTLGAHATKFMMGDIRDVIAHSFKEPPTVRAHVDARIAWLPRVPTINPPNKQHITPVWGTYTLFYRQHDFDTHKAQILSRIRRRGYRAHVMSYYITDTLPVTQVTLT